MIARGLRAPALVIADGAPGIWKAVRELWPGALEQRCTVHALRNVTGKLPERHHQEVKARWWKAFDEARSPGEAHPGAARHHRRLPRPATPQRWPSSKRDLPALVTHLQFPSGHRKRIRTTNLLERTFVEVRRRTKVIGRFPGETSALSLIWAVLELSITRLARREDEPQNRRRDRAPTPPATATPPPHQPRRTPRRRSPHNIPLKRSYAQTNSPGK